MVAPECRDALQADARQIRLRLIETAGAMMGFGERLVRSRSVLPHGTWLPWLAAETGMSVQWARNCINLFRRFADQPLCGSDVRQMDGIWLVSIRPDDRFTRNARMRVIPLHPQLVEQGFPRFAEESGDGPLFHDPDGQPVTQGGVDPAQKVIARIGRWVRQLGVNDPDILPNHAWRYRFRMTALRSGMDRTILGYVLGRAHPMPRKAFSDFPPDVLLHEISRLPRIEIAGE